MDDLLTLTRTHTYAEIARMLHTTRSTIAGRVWRLKNPSLCGPRTDYTRAPESPGSRRSFPRQRPAQDAIILHLMSGPSTLKEMRALGVNPSALRKLCNEGKVYRTILPRPHVHSVYLFHLKTN